MRMGGLALLMVASCSWAQSVPNPQGAQVLVGVWQGLGTLLEVDPDRPAESLRFDLEVDEALQGRGRVGGASIREWRLEAGARPLRISIRLEGALGPVRARNKAYLILWVTELQVERLTADFLLRSDPGFDPAACRGTVTLSRVRPLNDPPRPATPARGPSPP
jgi:hypothetical protein